MWSDRYLKYPPLDSAYHDFGDLPPLQTGIWGFSGWLPGCPSGAESCVGIVRVILHRLRARLPTVARLATLENPKSPPREGGKSSKTYRTPDRVGGFYMLPAKKNRNLLYFYE